MVAIFLGALQTLLQQFANPLIQWQELVIHHSSTRDGVDLPRAFEHGVGVVVRSSKSRATRYWEGQRPTGQTKAIFSEKWSKCQILMIRVLILASNILQRPISSLYSSQPLWYSEPPLSRRRELVSTNFKCKVKLPAFRSEIFKQKEKKHTRDYDNKV